jgi:hypothetical protein
MTELLTARPPGPATSASALPGELNAVLTRIHLRCRPDLAVTAAQRLEALLGVLDAGTADLQAARSGASGWLGLGSAAFVLSADRAEADARRAAVAIRAGGAALRTYAHATQACLERVRGIEHGLLLAGNARSRRLAAEAAVGAPPRLPRGPAPGADEAFEGTAGDLLRTARLVLADAEAAIAALVARLRELTSSGLPTVVAPDPGPGTGAVGGDPRSGTSSLWGTAWHAQGAADSVTTLWTGGRALWMFAAYTRAPRGAAQALAAARYAESLRPFLGLAARATLPLTIGYDIGQVIKPAHPGQRGWGDRAAGVAGAAGATTMLLTSAGLISLGPVGAAAAVGGLLAASAWQLGNLAYDHRKEIAAGLSTAWRGIESGGEDAWHSLQRWGGSAVDGIEAAGGAAVDTLGDVGGSAVDEIEAAGGAAVRGVAGFGRGLLHGIGLG